MGPYLGPINPIRKNRKMSDSELTITVSEAGKRYFNLCRNASYDAAARGEIPAIRIGRLLRVPVRALERMLDRTSERGPS
jgi:Helix-turn-helix domain